MKDMEKLFSELLDTAKKNKRGLILLKNSAVRCQQYELASQLRELEKEIFPESEEEKEAKKLAKELNLLFRMVDLNIPEPTCWIISQAVKSHAKKKGKFDLQAAASLVAKQKEIFDLD